MADFFAKITFGDVLIQLIGFAAMALGIFSFQMKKRNGILILQTVAGFLWGLQFFFLGKYTGAALNGVSVARNILYSFKEKHKWARSKLLPAAVITAFFLSGIFTYDGIISLCPTAAMIISSVALFISDEKKIRILSLFVSPLWLIYDAASFSIAGVISEIFTLTSIFIALYRFKKVPEKDAACPEK